MCEKCESMSRCGAACHREPRTPSPNQQSVWRLAAMHLKPYPKLPRSELRLEPSPDSQRGSLHLRHQGAMRTEWGLRPACARTGSSSSSSTGPSSGGRCPLAVISTNALRGAAPVTANHKETPASRLSGDFHGARARKTKSSSSQGSFTSSLLLLSSGWDNEASLSLFQAQYQAHDGEGDGPLDIWAVIKPGNTKEKIAIFASQQCGGAGRVDVDGGSEGNCDGAGESEPMADAEEDSGPGPGGPAVRLVSMKAKGCWEGECLVAKRRRRSAHHLQERDGPPEPQAAPQGGPGQEQLLSQPPPAPEDQDCVVEVVEEEEEEEEEEEGGGKSLSVVEMVAFLEQRASDQQVDSKPVSLRSSTSITLSKAPPTLELPARDGPDEEGESVRVSDMVAKLESECLKRRGMREGGGGGGGGGGAGGELSRNNSLRRAVGRVLLAGADACSASAQPPSPPPAQDRPQTAVTPPESPAKPGDVPDPRAPPAPLSPAADPGCGAFGRAGATEEGGLEAGGLEALMEGLGGEAGRLLVQAQTQSQLKNQYQVSSDATGPREEEPLPGMLFFSLPPVSEPPTHPHAHALPPPGTEPAPPPHTKPSAPASPPLLLLLLRPPSIAHPSLKGDDEGGPREEEEEDDNDGCRERAPFPLRRLVSHEFLEMRFKIQLLLEPQQYLAFLPHHVLLQVFSLLPTQTLAALKCSCRYFKFIIESYGVRPADSRWVCDPRYRDDPCKQCKRRYGRGDVSLCRWHHKPYCQAMPYGPGYWMCCHGTRRDAPGCNVGLHDNRWVPAFHSISMPIYKRARDAEEEVV